MLNLQINPNKMDLRLLADVAISISSFSLFIAIGGIIPLLASILSLCWFATLFLRHIEKDHKKSFKSFIKWYWNYFKKN